MLAVVPEFLRLATTFTDNSAAAIAARRLLEKEAFYTKLHVEFKSLDETLSAWDHKIKSPEPVERTLIRALDALESRCVKTLVQNFSVASRFIIRTLSDCVVLVLTYGRANNTSYDLG